MLFKKKSSWVQLRVLTTTVCENILSIVGNRKKFKTLIKNLNSTFWFKMEIRKIKSIAIKFEIQNSSSKYKFHICI